MTGTSGPGTERFLRASELAHYLEHHPWPSYLWRHVGDEFVLIDFNGAASEITRGGVASYLGSTLEDLFGDRPSVLSMMRRTTRERCPLQHEVSYRFRSTGRLHDLKVTYVFVPPDLVVVHTEDVTESRNEIQERLRGLTRVRRIFDHLPDGIVALGEGRVIYTNPGLAQLVGAPREELEGADFAAWVHPEDRERLHLCYERPEILPERGPFQLRIGGGHSGWREVECFGSSFSLDGEPVVVGVIRDQSERVRRERELAVHRARLEQSQRLARLAYWEWDPTTERITYGPEALRILGLDPDRWDGRLESALELVHPEDRAQVEEAIADVLEGRSSRYEERYRVVREDGVVVPLQVLGEVERDEDGAMVRFHGAFQDVTELRETERALQASERRLRRLVLRSREALESERKRISRDLHDHLGQAAVTLRMQLLHLRSVVEDAEVGDEALDTLDDAVEELDVMMEWSRRLARELRPDLLDRLGLAAALRWHFERIGERSDLAVSVDLEGLTREPPEEVAVALYRIAQEAGRNVVRHADARTLWVGLRSSRRAWTLVVEDDGRGMARPPSDDALGILGMQEQATGIGGRFQISSGPRGGTRLVVTVPTSGRSA